MILTQQELILRNQMFLAGKISVEVFNIILQKKYFQIWVPKIYGGLGLSLLEGLSILQRLAQIDGSLGWFVTLCSGANFFSRNLQPDLAREIFLDKNTCFGGSGFIGGTAEKVGTNYLINGLWNYATGAPHLSHFTINAYLIENGKQLLDANGHPIWSSFLLNSSQVNLIADWHSMGMLATESHSFKVNQQLVSENLSFKYNHFYTDDVLDSIPFDVFADLTLIVNYLGMAKHFVDASKELVENKILIHLENYIEIKTSEIHRYANQIEQLLSEQCFLDTRIKTEIHQQGEQIVKDLVRYITTIFPSLGIKVASATNEINQIFRDFFTATQHKNFRKIQSNTVAFNEVVE